MGQSSAEVVEESAFQFGSTPAADADVEVNHAVAALGDEFAGLLAGCEQAVLDTVGAVWEAFEDGQFGALGGETDGGVEVVPVATGLGERGLASEGGARERGDLTGRDTYQNTNKEGLSCVHNPYNGG